MNLIVKICVILSLIVLAVNGQEKKANEPVAFGTWFQGDWQVSNYEFDLNSPDKQLVDETKFVILKDNITGNLVGEIIKNDTENDSIEIRQLMVELEDEETGTLSVGESEFNMETLMSLQFNTLDNQVKVSSGKWLAGNGDHYQFAIYFDRWTLTVYDQKKQTGFLYAAKKIHPEVVPTFFQKYGSFVAIIGFIVFNFYKAQKMQQNQQRMSQLQARQDQATPAPANAPKVTSAKKKSKKD